MSKLQVQKQQNGDVLVLALQGMLDVHTVPVFESALTEAISNEQFNIVVDLSKLEYISSAGLGVFMGYIEEIRSHGGDIKIAAASPKVFKIFDLLGFPNLFEFFDSATDAIHKFRAQ